MSPVRLVDTNVIVRYLTRDHVKFSLAAKRLFLACERGELTLVLLPSVLAESVFVLESFYKHPRGQISQTLSTLITSAGVQIDELAIQIDALRRYAATKLHFVDCVIAATAASMGIAVASFDSGFRNMPDVQIDLD